MEKSKFIQNSVFLVPLTKKLISFTLLLLLVMIIAACNKKDKPLSDREVTINLAGDWEFNKEHLLGMWKPVYLAYTKDGKEFSGRDVISSDYTVEITDNRGELQFAFLDNYAFDYSTPSHFAKLIQKQYIYHSGFSHYLPYSIQYKNFTEIANFVARSIESGLMYDYNNNISMADFFANFEFNEPTGDELKIYTIHEKAYSFIIRNDDLFIYFIGIENINLLILKKN